MNEIDVKDIGQYPETVIEKAIEELIRWLKSLNVTSDVDLETLLIGYQFALFLHKIDEQFFHEGFVETVTDYGRGSNERVRFNNIRKCAKKLFEYYDDVLHLNIKSEKIWELDCFEIAKGDSEGLYKLITLLVGAAFLGRCKNLFVQAISTIPETAQKEVATCVRNVQKYSEHIPFEEELPSPVVSPRDSGRPENNTELEAKVIALQQRCDQVTAEKDRLESELEEQKKKTEANTEAARQYERLVDELKDAKEKHKRVEGEKMQLEGESDQHKHTIDELMEKNGQLAEEIRVMRNELARDEYLKLQDELDQYKSKELDVTKYQQQIKQLNQKIKEMEQYKTENRVLNEKLQTYINFGSELDDEKKKVNTLQQQLGRYKADAETKSAEVRMLTVKVDRFLKLEDDLKEAHEKITQLETEKGRWTMQKKQYEDELAALGHHVERKDSLSLELTNGNAPDVSFRDDSFTVLPDNMRASSEESAANARRVMEMESALALTNLEISDLRKKLEETERLTVEGNSDAQVRNLKADREKADIEKNMAVKRAEAAENERNKAVEEATILRGKKVELERKLVEGEEKMRSYLDKARSIIVDQDRASRSTENGGHSVLEFNSLRKDIEERDKKILYLESKLEKITTMHEQEQRLVTTAWYTMAHQRVAGDLNGDPGSSGPDSARERSFLMRQKQPNALNLSVLAAVFLVAGPIVWAFSYSLLLGTSRNSMMYV